MTLSPLTYAALVVAAVAALSTLTWLIGRRRNRAAVHTLLPFEAQRAVDAATVKRWTP